MRARMSGSKKLVGLEIEPAVLQDGDAGMLQDLSGVDHQIEELPDLGLELEVFEIASVDVPGVEQMASLAVTPPVPVPEQQGSIRGI